MEATPSFKHEMNQMLSIEQRRIQRLKEGDLRQAKADKRTAATEARIAQCQRDHEQACAQEAARLVREIGKVHTGTEKKLSEMQASTLKAKERREAVEAETRQVLAEVAARRADYEGMRSKLQQEITKVDRNMEEVLHSTNEDIRSFHANVEGEVRGIFDTMSAETTRVWSLEDHESFARDLTGAKTLDAPDPLPSRVVLPFGPTQNPFHGYGTYGLKAPQPPPRGFMQETTRRAFRDERNFKDTTRLRAGL